MQQQIITIAPLPVSEKKTRAAAYVRVSTNKDDQLNSFAAQYIHYKKLLEESISEELVDVYADEGISGTTTKERDAFNKLISDCEQGSARPRLPQRKSQASFLWSTRHLPKRKQIRRYANGR